MKKGRHRRFEEARALKQTNEITLLGDEEPCAECGAAPGQPHSSWCMATEELDDEDDSELR